MKNESDWNCVIDYDANDDDFDERNDVDCDVRNDEADWNENEKKKDNFYLHDYSHFDCLKEYVCYHVPSHFYYHAYHVDHFYLHCS